MPCNFGLKSYWRFQINSCYTFIQFWNHMYDFRPNKYCTPLSSITIIYHYLFAFRIMCLAIDFFILHSVLAPTTVFLKALRWLDIGQGLFSQEQKHVSNSSQFDWTSLVNKVFFILWLKYFFLVQTSNAERARQQNSRHAYCLLDTRDVIRRYPM